MSLNRLSRKPIKRSREETVDSTSNSNKNDVECPTETDSEEEALYPDIKAELEECRKTSLQFKDTCRKYIIIPKISLRKVFRIILIFSAILFVVLAYFFYCDSRPTSLSAMTEKLVDKYHLPTQWTKKIIFSALEEVVKKNSSTPAVITILANPGTTTRALQFCEDLANSLVPSKYIIIDEHIYGQGSEEYIKEQIDYVITSRLDKDDLNVVIIDQLENIPINAFMIFHNLCDETYPTYENVIYLFILTLNEDLDQNADINGITAAAYQQFRHSWQHSHPDEIDSLITRLTVNVINFRPKSQQ